MADEEDFMERISREVDDRFKPADCLLPPELQELYTQAIDELKTSKIEFFDLQCKFKVFKYFATLFTTPAPTSSPVQFAPDFTGFRLSLFPRFSGGHSRPLVPNKAQSRIFEQALTALDQSPPVA